MFMGGTRNIVRTEPRRQFTSGWSVSIIQQVGPMRIPDVFTPDQGRLKDVNILIVGWDENINLQIFLLQLLKRQRWGNIGGHPGEQEIVENPKGFCKK